MTRFFVSAILPAWILVSSLAFPFVLGAETYPDWIFPGDKIEEAEGRGLMIRSNPSGAKVYIDGIERGLTPLGLETIRAGEYLVRLQKDGYRERYFRVRVRPGSVLAVSLELQEARGKVLLKIQPVPGSPGIEKLPLEPKISVEGESFASPGLELPVGFRTIQVRAFGWEDFSSVLYVEDDSLTELEVKLKPASFRVSLPSLSRRRFNPANSGSLGTTVFSFDVSAPGTGTLRVFNQEGRAVFTQNLGRFETWSQQTLWNGRNQQGEILPDGIYTLRINAESLPWDNSPPATSSQSLDVQIDSTRQIRPLTMSSGKGGLLFTPAPLLLPPGSFQIEGSLLFGSPPETSGGAEQSGPWKSLPFAAAFRFSPLERLETAAALNVLPYFRGDAQTGIAGSAKWVFLNPSGGNSVLGAAAGASFGWARKTRVTPFGAPSGIEVFFPFQADRGGIFSVLLTPAALWTGDEGFPWEPVPRLLLSGGFLIRTAHSTAGLSTRWEYRFSGGIRPSGIIGGELKFFPPPSSFVFSLMGGLWIKNSSLGGFGGLGIGMIY